MLIFKLLLKFLTEGFAVSISVGLLHYKKCTLREILLVGLTASAIFAILDSYAIKIATGARSGAGIGIGLNSVGFERYTNNQDENREGFLDYYV